MANGSSPDTMWPDPKILEAVHKIAASTGGHTVTTYPGHQDGADKSVDVWSPSVALAQWTCDNAVALGVHYIAYANHQWNGTEQPKPYAQWRTFADRGNPTDNHVNHMHVGFGSLDGAYTGTTNANPSSVSTGSATTAVSLNPLDGLNAAFKGLKWIITPSNWFRLAIAGIAALFFLVGVNGMFPQVMVKVKSTGTKIAAVAA